MLQQALHAPLQRACLPIAASASDEVRLMPAAPVALCRAMLLLMLTCCCQAAFAD